MTRFSPDATRFVSCRRAPKPDGTGLPGAFRSMRMQLAKVAGVPAYLIFTNATPDELCRLRPHTDEDFLRVPGIGAAKRARYGRKVLGTVADYERSHPDD